MADLLYHYTSMTTLHAILDEVTGDTLTLRATGIKYLNDSKEYNLALEILRDLLIEFDESDKCVNKKDLRNRLTIERMGFLKEFNADLMPPFIVSLSEEQDSLPMWNTYGDNSLGVAIGFKNIKELTNNNILLKKCEYDYESVKEKLINKIVSIHSSLFFDDKNFLGIIRDIDSEVYTFFEGIVSSLKDSAFKYENEWRFIVKQEYDFKLLKFNVTNGLPKPYIEFPLDISYIDEIVIGPCANFDLAKGSLFMMLKKVGITPTFEGVEEGKVNIKASKCPYRTI